MLPWQKSPSAGSNAARLGRTEMAARLAMVWDFDELAGPHRAPAPYGWCGAGLALSCAVLGAVFLFGPL